MISIATREFTIETRVFTIETREHVPPEQVCVVAGPILTTNEKRKFNFFLVRINDYLTL